MTQTKATDVEEEETHCAAKSAKQYNRQLNENVIFLQIVVLKLHRNNNAYYLCTLEKVLFKT